MRTYIFEFGNKLKIYFEIKPLFFKVLRNCKLIIQNLKICLSKLDILDFCPHFKIWWIHITNYLGNYYFKDIHSLVFCNVLWEIFTGNDKVPLMTQHAERRMTLQMFFNPSVPSVITVGTCFACFEVTRYQ